MREILKLATLAAGLLTGCAQPDRSELKVRREALPDTLGKLYDFVRSTQIRVSDNERAVGTWTSRAVATGPFGGFSRPESNVFMPLQMSLALHRVAERYELEGLDALDETLAGMLRRYVEDAATTGEPEGSIAHWALYETTDGKPVRYADVPTQSYARLKLFNIANDLDTSSQAYLWSGLLDVEADFRKAYVPMLAAWRDLGDRTPHRQEAAWKEPGSGAFLTWNEPDETANAESRIPGGVNDVDCVVNLNVLTSLDAAERQAALPDDVRTAKDATCELLVRTAQDGKLDRCAVYYDETHAYMAFARALRLGATCLEPARATLTGAVATVAAQAADESEDVVDMAEMMLALKWLFPSETESRAAVEPLIGDLKAKLTRQIRRRVDGLTYLPEGTLYHGTVYPFGRVPWKGRWLSDAASTVYAIEALAAP